MKISYDPNLTCTEFQALHSALIDASSIIYMQKAGFLDLVIQNLEIFSLPEILEETGFEIRTIKCLKSPATYNSNDSKFIETAVKFQLPVISEDKGILKHASSAGLLFYNSLMMLNFLFFRKAISGEEHKDYLKELKIVARYSREIFDYGEAVFDAINTIRLNNSNSSESEKIQQVKFDEVR